MNTNQFNVHFSLQRLATEISSAPINKSLRKAAVLVPLLEVNGQLQILLTRRALHLRAHPGQYSFPGGKVDDADNSLVETALREADEEIGLSPDNVTIVGSFPSHATFTGFEVTPIIGLINQPFDIILDPGEVAETFWVPLQYFTNANNRYTFSFFRNGNDFDVHYMPYKGKFIWGVTAAIIDLLCRHIELSKS
ncbi:CoA pyrophosphatase [Shewanella sp. KT0246]|uniref:CoA pyrophosphatase n=1 Tax=Shewanella sp. KT0246 TaxID=2815912 RepID=UPI001BBFE69B|nr:CoA pyrophosphatase [Shewanella sp. KT0246]GIU53252.1 coenzyme A pyrophosphatase [Shewanella sp. KT0246]